MKPDAPSPPGPPQPCDLVVLNALLLTVDRQDRVIPNGALAVAGGRILAVGGSDEIRSRFDPSETLDARGGVVHPGFIDAHIHVSQYTARSVLPLMEKQGLTMGHWKGALTPEDEHASARLAALDYLKSGHTGFVDPGTIFEPDAVAAVAGEIPIRIWLTDPYVADRVDSLVAHTPELVSQDFLARWPKGLDEALSRVGSQLFRNRDPDALVQAFVGLYGIGTDSMALLRHAVQVARENGVQFQEHLAYVPAAHLEQERELGRPLLAAWREAGLLGPETTFIHMNRVTSDEVGLLAKLGVRVVCCPYGQMQMLAREGAQVRTMELHRNGVAVGIGSDIPRAVEFDGLGSLMAAAAAAAGQAATPTEVLRMRTIGAAATIGADRDVGSLEPGKRADFVVRSPEAATHFGFDPALEAAVIGSRAGIRAVIVNGRKVVWDGRFLAHDETEIIQAAHRSARGIAGRIGL